MGGSPIPMHILTGGFCLFTTHINGEGRKEGKGGWEGERKEGRKGRKQTEILKKKKKKA